MKNRLIIITSFIVLLFGQTVLKALDDTLWCKYTYPTSIYAVKFTPDGQYIAAGIGNQVIMYNALTGDSVKSYKIINASGYVTSIDISSDGKLLATNSGVFNLQNDSIVSTISEGKCKFSQDCNYMVTANGNIYDTKTWQTSGTFTTFGSYPNGESILSIDISADNKYIATSYDINKDGATTGYGCRLYLLKNLKDSLYYTLEEGKGSVNPRVCFSPDGQYLASEASDDTIRIWTLSDRTIYKKFCHYGAVDAIAFSLDGNYLVEGGGGYFNYRTNIWEIYSESIKYTYDLNWLVKQYLKDDWGDISNNISLSSDLKYITIGGSIGFYILNAKWNITSVIDKGITTQIVYPNPTSGIINIGLDCINKIQNYNIYDNKGTLLLTKTLTETTQNTLSIDFSPYNVGIYFLKIYCGNNVTTYKIVKEG